MPHLLAHGDGTIPAGQSSRPGARRPRRLAALGSPLRQTPGGAAARRRRAMTPCIYWATRANSVALTIQEVVRRQTATVSDAGAAGCHWATFPARGPELVPAPQVIR